MAEHAIAAPRRKLDGALADLVRLQPALTGLAVVAVIALIAAPGMLVSDTWLALVAGREIVQHGLPSHDHLTVLANGRRWVDQQWLGQLAFYGAWRLWGLGGVSALATGAALCAYGLPAVAAARRDVNRATLLCLPLLAVAAGAWGFQPRPQTLAVPAFAAVLHLLLTDPRGERPRTLLVLPLLVLWANLHGSVVLGAAIVVVYALFLAGRGQRLRALPFAAAPICVFASPYALSLPHYYRLMLLDPPFKRLDFAGEWESARLSPDFAFFYLLVAVALVVVVRSRERYTGLELVLLGLTAAAGFFALRNTMWFGLTALFVLPLGSGPRRRTGGVGAVVLSLLLGATIVSAVVVSAARPASYYTSRGLTQTAADAARRTLQHARGPIFADGWHGDWLLWRVPASRGRVAYDSRLELLTMRQLASLAPFILHKQPTPALRPYALAVVAPQWARVLARSGWGRIVYADRLTSVVVRSVNDDRR